MSNLTARVRFSSVTVYSIGHADIEISGSMDVSIRICDDAPIFDIAESISDIEVESARVPRTGRKIAVKDGSKLVAKLAGCPVVRDRLMDEASQLGWEWCQDREMEVANGEME